MFTIFNFSFTHHWIPGSFLATAAIVASVIRFAVIPSESMIPALLPGDVSSMVHIIALHYVETVNSLTT